MSNPTSSFGWQMPTASDLVTDLPADFETFGQAVDTTLADLKGGTTGQVLSKASNTDMDFTWVAQDDSNAIQNAIVDAKGDLIAASAADTPARLAVGTNGQVLTADSTASTGLAWATPSGGSNQFFAGKNKIIQANFANWQRSTSATVTSENYWAPDRFRSTYVAGGATVTWSQQTFTPGTAPVSGYEGQFFSRIAATSGGGSTVIGINQRSEDVRTLAGQTATISFWAKADSARTATILILQFFGSGGSGDVTVLNTTQALTTSWTRYSFTTSVPSISGKTIAAGSYLVPFIYYNTGQASGSPQLDIWGVQLEAGSTATDFQTATGTIQGELAACQRYYWRTTALSAGDFLTAFGNAYSTTAFNVPIPNPSIMRVAPTVLDYATIRAQDSSTGYNLTNLTIYSATPQTTFLTGTVASGLTQWRGYLLAAQSGTNGYIGLSAEL